MYSFLTIIMTYVMDMNDSAQDDSFFRVPVLLSLQYRFSTLLTRTVILFYFRESCDCIRRCKEREMVNSES